MSKMMIYRAIVGASMVLASTASREKVWGVEMYVKAIDRSDEQVVNEHKADGWQNSPKAVIDELEKAKLTAQKGALTAEIAWQKQIDDLNASLAEQQATFDAQRENWAVEKATLTAELENQKAKVTELTLELEKLKTTRAKKVKDDNGG